VSRTPARKPPAKKTAVRTHASGPKPALKIVPNDPAELLRQYCDELGSLEALAVEFRPKLKRIEVLKDLIRERFEKQGAEKTFEARGETYGAALGAKAYRSVVDYPGICSHMGLKAYAAISTPTLADLEATLPPNVFARFVRYAYTGARPVKTFEVSRPV
jgi:hypothetical protein